MSEEDDADVYYIWLRTGQTIAFSLDGAEGTDFDLYLFDSSSSDIDSGDYVAMANSVSYPEELTYTVPEGGGGTHRILCRRFSGSGEYTLSYEVTTPAALKPVFRFYNVKAGVHFYTASQSEKDSVNANLSNIFKYEGVSYEINVANPVNSQSLYRFYNAKAGVHFYTASESEKSRVIATLGALYKYEGVAYKVSLTPTPKTVWRFYNFRKGVHFYTADPTEKANVERNLSSTYKLDGIGYYIGQ